MRDKEICSPWLKTIVRPRLQPPSLPSAASRDEMLFGFCLQRFSPAKLIEPSVQNFRHREATQQCRDVVLAGETEHDVHQELLAAASCCHGQTIPLERDTPVRPSYPLSCSESMIMCLASSGPSCIGRGTLATPRHATSTPLFFSSRYYWHTPIDTFLSIDLFDQYINHFGLDLHRSYPLYRCNPAHHNHIAAISAMAA